MWTGSTTVPQWLHSSDKQPVFVANCIAEIFVITTMDEWNIGQPTDNPAHAGTRGIAASARLKCSWLKSPDFIRTLDWPSEPPDAIFKKIRLTYLATGTKASSEIQTPQCSPQQSVCTIASPFEWRKSSSNERFLRNVAYVLSVLPKISGH